MSDNKYIYCPQCGSQEVYFEDDDLQDDEDHEEELTIVQCLNCFWQGEETELVSSSSEVKK